MNVRRPTARGLRVTVPVVLPILVVGVFVLRGCHTGDIPNLHAPPDVGAPPPSTTEPIDLTGVSLAGVDGTTTTAPARATGTAHLTGVVQGPQGPVPGAIVRLEHLVAHAPPIDVTAGADGRYDAPNIAGGRYRVRAFLPPALLQTDPPVFFLADGEQRRVDLQVDEFTGLEVSSAFAPDPPRLRQPMSLVVRVATRAVDDNGVARAQPVANATVVLSNTSGWVVQGAPSAVTNGDGDAGFELQCAAPGANQVQVQVRPTPTDVPQNETLSVSACVDTTTTTSTAPSSSSSTSSSSSSSHSPPGQN